jgi:hypothetical protein
MKLKNAFEIAQCLTYQAEKQTANIGFETEGCKMDTTNDTRADEWKAIAENALNLARQYEESSKHSEADCVQETDGPKRSIPGHEEIVNIFVIGPARDFADDDCQPYNRTVIMQSFGPDFSDTW